ncbi:MAG: SH3 domain-containing protein [Pseudomonadota bacterium]
MIFRIVLMLCATVVLAPGPIGAETATIEISATTPEPGRVGPETGFPLPRFVSMDAAEGRARRGPSRSHRIDWVFTRRGMPLIIIAEHGHWRRVIDPDGEGGWMHYSLLSGVRTGIVETDMVELRTRPETIAPVRAQAELGVIGRLQECRDEWCLFVTGGYRGWVPQDALWGTSLGEVIN